jgi:hypothetical protein
MRGLLIFELNRKMEAFSRKEDRDWHKLRVLATILVSPHSKKRIKPKDLIKIPSIDEVSIPKPTMSREDRKKQVDKAMRIWKKKVS